VEAAARAMAVRVAESAPHARIEGYLVSEMVKGGVETVIGVHRDPAFGPIVTFGMGGVLVELLKDVVSRPAPVSEEEAHAMIAAIRTAPLLTGYRGSAPLAVGELARTIAAVSRFAAATGARLRAVEINPLLVREHDVVALDALIQLDSEGGASAHL
jgi:succinyl-CoA synthetase beta subunit